MRKSRQGPQSRKWCLSLDVRKTSVCRNTPKYDKLKFVGQAAMQIEARRSLVIGFGLNHHFSERRS
jgi:hypothetical protein